MRRIVFTKIALLVIALLAFMSASFADCSLNGPCCSASAGGAQNPCDLSTDTCTCTFTCGPNQQTCSCSCMRGAKQTVPSTALRTQLQANSGLKLSGATPKLADLATWLQAAFNWWVSVEPEHANINVPAGTYSGTFQQVIEQIATATGTTAVVNDQTSAISFR